MKEITIEILQRCENNCIYCSSKPNDYIIYPDMTLNYFNQIIDDAHNNNFTRVNISGGEPFLNKKIIDMVKYCKTKNMEVYIYTSGIMCNTSISENIFKEIKMYVDKIIFNLQTLEEKKYNDITRTKGHLCNVKKSIISCKNTDIITEINFVPNKVNINDFKEIVCFCKENKININIIRLIKQGQAKFNDIELYEDELKQFEKLINNINDVNIRVGNSIKYCNNCNAVINKLVIKYNGDIIPCEAFKDVDVDVEENPYNIYNNDTLDDAIHNSNYLKHFLELNNKNKCKLCVSMLNLKDKK